VHRLVKTKLPRAESKARIKIERRLREVQARRSKVNDLFEVAVQKYIAPTEAEAIVSCPDERSVHWPLFTSERTAGQGPRNGGFSGLCPFDDAQASSEATSETTNPPVAGQWSGPRQAEAADEGAGPSLHPARERVSSYPPRVGERSTSAGSRNPRWSGVSVPAAPASACGTSQKLSPKIGQTRR